MVYTLANEAMIVLELPFTLQTVFRPLIERAGRRTGLGLEDEPAAARDRVVTLPAQRVGRV